MPYVIKRVGTLPAVVIRFYGDYDGDHSAEIEQQLESIFADVTGPIWRILDASEFNLTFEAMWQAIIHERDTRHWTFSDSRVRTVAVSNSDLAYIATRVAALLIPDLKIPLFASLDKAVAYVRAEIEQSHAPEKHLQRLSG